ncbi:hypothetical protein [Diplocloster modestus]|uniref:Uncharacterized protein n=1 Tax=Diplocloster modestus TaxID=2850322 RepID=A0ABS6K105_9FIRM|nr:hypothetical protein [Diplocloster modestus]MBU9724528.1 hypothetical protein [Diplocloster modestus]
MGEIYPVPERVLKKKGALLFSEIEEGFSRYEHVILERTEPEYRHMLDVMLQINGREEAYCDFYYGRLSREEQRGFRRSLSEEQLAMLMNFYFQKDEVYYPLTRSMIRFLSDITAREVLFSTFYFTRYPCTVWGNYGLRYPVFFKDKRTKFQYCDLI